MNSLNYLVKTLFISLIIFSSEITNGYSQYSKITDYQVYFGVAKKDKEYLIIIRKFTKDQKEYFLLVNPFDLKTKIILINECKYIESGLDKIKPWFSKSAYFRSLNDSKENAMKMQDAGITHSLPSETGIILTIDLCPSEHPLNRKIFTSLIEALKDTELPVPIAIAISGHWINKHPQDLEWLKELQSKGVVNITWINHSLNHYYNKKLPLENNFMLNNKTNVKNEILGNEKLMIINGLEPSVFFRFPGLISNNELLDTVCSYGLITIGSDAWLAKGGKVNNGSIVLIHGNGNDHIGVSKFIKLINSKKPEELKKSWLLFDLRESIEEEYIKN